VQDEVNQDYSEQNEVDGMKKGALYGTAHEFILCLILSKIVVKNPN